MKYAVFSDIHLRMSRAQGLDINSFMIKSMDEFYREAEKRKIKTVLSLGDTFHVKNMISSELLSFTLDYFRARMKEKRHIFLVGNHDRINAETNFLKIFENDCKVVHKYWKFDDGDARLHFFSFAEDSILKKRMKKAEKLKGKPNILLGHLGLQGFSYDNGHEDIYSDLSEDDIDRKKFNHVFSGHYHSHQNHKGITYVSSPMQIKHGEKGPNGFIFFDSRNPSDFEFIENIHSPKFLTFEWKKSQLKQIRETEKAFLRIIIPQRLKTDLRLMNEFKKKLLEKNYDVKFIVQKDTEELKNIDIPSVSGWDSFIHSNAEDIIREYLKNYDLSEDVKDEYLEFLLS